MAFHRFLAAPKHPIREVLRAMTGCAPPRFVRGYSLDRLSDDETGKLQDWAVAHRKPRWLTGIGLLEAAEQRQWRMFLGYLIWRRRYGTLPPGHRQLLVELHDEAEAYICQRRDNDQQLRVVLRKVRSYLEAMQ